jgi:ribose transport system ATP-binding protein
MSERREAILQAEGITKTFPGVKALDGVDLELRSGRLLALLGENGAGKSTLMNVLSGVFPPDAGTIRLRGQAVTFQRPSEAQAAGIGIVHQELNLIPHLSVAENIFLGREPRGRGGLIDYRRLHRETERLLGELELPVAPDTLIADLRVGQQQLVEIAKALSLEARILILDEPTSSLSAHEVETLFKVIAALKADGVALVYITHKFEELARLCDDVTIMRDGAVVGGGRYEDFNRESILRLMAGRASKETFIRSATKLGPELLRAQGIRLPGSGIGRQWLVEDVSLAVRAGEVLGLFGLVGAGRSELLETLFGAHHGSATGELTIDGESHWFRGPAEAIAAGMALAPEDRKRDGLILGMSVRENASLPNLEPVTRRGLLSLSRESRFIAPFIERFRVKTPSLETRVVNLSGGNQQKVILAKWLATGPKVILLDEPTRGIDVNAKREIYAFIDELARNGLGILLVSSEIPEILALSDRILVMCEGRQTAEFARANATPERLLEAAFPEALTISS